MDTGTFSVIIFLLMIIIGGYLIFTDSVQGNSKTILMIVILILTISLITKFGLFTGYSKILDSPVLATSPIKALGDYKYTAAYSLSTWIYVNDWNAFNGSEKDIIVRNVHGNSTPRLYLDAYENQLNIDYTTGTDQKATLKRIKIPNVNTQKWINITCCFSDTNVDTYMNGKLVDTTIPGESLYYAGIEKGDKELQFNICPNGIGFSGYISNTRYYPEVLTPQKAWDIYNKGYSSNMLGNLLNKYNAEFKFTNNGSEVVKFNIM